MSDYIPYMMSIGDSNVDWIKFSDPEATERDRKASEKLSGRKPKPKTEKATAYNPVQPRWPKGSPSGLGGQWRAKDGAIGFHVEKDAGQVSHHDPDVMKKIPTNKVNRAIRKDFAKSWQGETLKDNYAAIGGLKNHISEVFTMSMAHAGETLRLDRTTIDTIVNTTVRVGKRSEDYTEMFNAEVDFSVLLETKDRTKLNRWMELTQPTVVDALAQYLPQDREHYNLENKRMSFDLFRSYVNDVDAFDTINHAGGLRYDADNKVWKLISQDEAAQRPMYSYGSMAAWVDSWARSSNDHNYQMLETQRLAADMIDSEIAPWQKDRYQESLDRRNKFTDQWGDPTENEHNGRLADNAAPFESAIDRDRHFGKITRFVQPVEQAQHSTREAFRYMYDTTQAWFGERGYKDTDTVRLYRGFAVPKDSEPGRAISSGREGTVARFTQNPLESWSLDPKIAQRFAGTNQASQAIAVVAMDVPLSRIFSTPHTGFGCFEESEFVVLTPDNIVDSAMVIYANFTDENRMHTKAVDYIPYMMSTTDENVDWIKLTDIEATERDQTMGERLLEELKKDAPPKLPKPRKALDDDGFFVKASAIGQYDPMQPRWSAGSPSGLGGQWKPKMGGGNRITFTQADRGMASDTVDGYKYPDKYASEEIKKQVNRLSKEYNTSSSGGYADAGTLKHEIASRYFMEMVYDGRPAALDFQSVDTLVKSIDPSQQSPNADQWSDMAKNFPDARIDLNSLQLSGKAKERFTPDFIDGMKWVCAPVYKAGSGFDYDAHYDKVNNTVSPELFARLYNESVSSTDYKTKFSKSIQNNNRSMTFDKDSNTFRFQPKKKNTFEPVYSYGAISGFIQSWAASSNDHSMQSLAAQRVAAEMMGTKLSPWQEQNYQLTRQMRESEYNRTQPWSNEIGGKLPKVDASVFLPFETSYDYRDGSHSFLQPSSAAEKVTEFSVKYIYDRTQQWFRERGYKPDDTVRLYRGFRVEKGTPLANTIANGGEGLKAKFTQNPLESWSISRYTAEGFGGGYSTVLGVVVAMDVPVKRVFSHAHTGFGCYHENEFVVLSTDHVVDEAIVIRVQ